MNSLINNFIRKCYKFGKFALKYIRIPTLKAVNYDISRKFYNIRNRGGILRDSEYSE